MLCYFNPVFIIFSRKNSQPQRITRENMTFYATNDHHGSLHASVLYAKFIE